MTLPEVTLPAKEYRIFWWKRVTGVGNCEFLDDVYIWLRPNSLRQGHVNNPRYRCFTLRLGKIFPMHKKASTSQQSALHSFSAYWGFSIGLIRSPCAIAHIYRALVAPKLVVLCTTVRSTFKLGCTAAHCTVLHCNLLKRGCFEINVPCFSLTDKSTGIWLVQG